MYLHVFGCGVLSHQKFMSFGGVTEKEHVVNEIKKRVKRRKLGFNSIDGCFLIGFGL